MIVTADQIFVLLKVDADGAVDLEADRLIDLLGLVGADLIEVAGQQFKLTPRGRRILAETSHFPARPAAGRIIGVDGLANTP